MLVVPTTMWGCRDQSPPPPYAPPLPSSPPPPSVYPVVRTAGFNPEPAPGESPELGCRRSKSSAAASSLAAFNSAPASSSALASAGPRLSPTFVPEMMGECPRTRREIKARTAVFVQSDSYRSSCPVLPPPPRKGPPSRVRVVCRGGARVSISRWDSSCQIGRTRVPAGKVMFERQA